LFFTNEAHPGEAVSAVKALAVASAEGQRIYQITSANVGVVNGLNIGQEVKDEIIASVAVGKEATVSESSITVAGWTGVGYIISDPDTGAGAYRISGGSNGALLLGVAWLMVGVLFFILALITASTITSPLLFAAPFILGTGLIFISFLTMAIHEMTWKDLDWQTLQGDLALVIGFFILPLTGVGGVIAGITIVLDAVLAVISTNWDLFFGK
jgi:hypothetical protein